MTSLFGGGVSADLRVGIYRHTAAVSLTESATPQFVMETPINMPTRPGRQLHYRKWKYLVQKV